MKKAYAVIRRDWTHENWGDNEETKVLLVCTTITKANERMKAFYTAEKQDSEAYAAKDLFAKVTCSDEGYRIAISWEASNIAEGCKFYINEVDLED